MEAAVRRHDAIMRAAIGEHRGHVFKTIGDAFCAAFERPEAAVAAMLAAQQRLADEDFTAVDGIRVRAAIHTGTADERDGDYFGPALNRIARLVAIGHGGQVLVSGVTSELVRDTLPPDVSLRDHGEHRLRDLTRPEHVYQLVAPGLRDDFPALRSLSELPNNLPRMLNAFVGREREIDEITALVRAHPLVTLVGAGGLGKTRTSLQVAAQLLDGSGDGVWFIELAPIANGDYLPATIAHAIGISLGNDGDPLDNLVRALRPKHLLLILDNCEHLITPVARIVSALLRGCPKLSVLASSRQALGVAGESAYRMPTLSVPTSAQAATLTAADAPTYAAIALFVERTRAVDQRFVLTDENAPIIADICRRLDGIALAIELAASRVKILTPRQLRDRLDERFRVLTGGSRDLLPRQQTLRALIDWSHDLLDERERTLFRRLGIFVNGFTLESAAAVVADEEIDEIDVLDLVESLVDKSLVATEADEVQRYRMLESTRAYALEKLDAAGERASLSARHLQNLRTRFATLAQDEARTGRQAERYAQFVAELEDVRAALGWALANDQVDDGAHLLIDLRRTWVEYGLEMESVAWHEAYLAAVPPDADVLLAHLLTDLALVVVNQGSIARMRELATPAVAHARAAGDSTALLRALYVLAWVDLHEGNGAEADRAISEAETIPNPAVNDRLYLVEARAQLCCLQEDYETAVRAFAHIRREQRLLGNANEELRAALNLANAEHNRGESRRAIEIAREILPDVRRDPDKTQVSNVLCNLAAALLAVDDVLGGAEIAREAITLVGADQPRHGCASLAVEDLALAYAIIGELDRAALLVAYSDAALREIGYVREVGEQRGYERLMALLRAGLEPAEIERISAQGRTLAPAAAFAIAIDDDAPHHDRTLFSADQRLA
jgi:predicted ATPase